MFNNENELINSNNNDNDVVENVEVESSVGGQEEVINLSKNEEVAEHNDVLEHRPLNTGFTPMPIPNVLNENNPQEENKDPVVVALNKQNKILKWTCVGLAACAILSVCLSLGSLLKANESEIFVSDIAPNRVTLTAVEGSNKTYTASEIYASNINSVVAIQTEIVSQNIFGQKIAGAAAGSGFIISEDGYVITNAHVVEDATTIKVLLSNGDEFVAKLIGMEEENDVAVLKIDSDKSFDPILFGDSDKMIIGEDVLAIGNPLGELTFSMTKGIVSAIDREIMVDNFTSINMFQVDCAVNEGNSGGPIFNMYGEVIGIVSAKYASETIEGLGFCIPINDVQNIVSDLIEHGQVMNKAYMGISVADVDSTMINQYNMVAGAYVSIIEKDSPAEKAGLKIGDIIVEFNGEKIESVSQLLSAKRDFRAGDTTTLKVWRSGEYVDLTITFDEYVEEVVNQIQEENNQQYQNQYGNQNPYGEFGNNFDSDMIEEFFKYYFNNR